MVDLLNKQAIFNAAYIGMASQNFVPSRARSGDTCYYRGPENRRCVFGHCIPDDMYDPYFEGARAGIVLEVLLGTQKLVQRADELGVSSFVNRLQRVHDKSTSTTMKGNLIAFAEREGLTVPPLPNPSVTQA